MSLRKISAKADGKLIRAYLTEHTALDAPMPEEHQGRVLANYYGRDARATWRADMAPEAAAALGIDTTAGPTEQVLDRLFEAKRADTGDPQVHVHNPMFNLVVTGGGHVGSLDTAEMHGRVKEFGAYFQGFLANELNALGIKTEYDKGEQAIAISCIPERVREAFSKGHKATVAKAKRYAREQGLDWEALGVERKLEILGNTAQNTKLSKDDGPRDERSWRDQADALGWRHETAITGERRDVLDREEQIARAAAFATRHIEEEFRTAAVLDLNVIRM